MLTLHDYRALVKLDDVFAPATAAQREDAPALVEALNAELRRDGTEARLREHLRQPPPPNVDPRIWLKALLTVRGPNPLPEAFHARMDALLQQERQRAPSTDAASLPRLADAGAAARCSLWRGDITTLRADAIVNAANARMLGCFTPFHPCIDNAIHSAAGPRLREDCGLLMQRQGADEATGAAKATRGYHLPSRFVLHTVGPIVQGGLRASHAEALASSYRACLDVCLELPQVRSVAFCAISTGVFRYPREEAAQVALRTVARWLTQHPGTVEHVIFNVFAEEDEAAYRRALQTDALA